MAPNPSISARIRAFSLIEVLVVVALLSVIIIGLLAMFGQTQRAMLAGTTQVDVLESGRAATELMARELEQIAPAGLPFVVNCHFTNSFSSNRLAGIAGPGPGGTTPPFKIGLLDPADFHTNMFEQIFFLSRGNAPQWRGVGYFIDTHDVPTSYNSPFVDTRQLGLGTLYRWEADTNAIAPDSLYQINSLFSRYLDRYRNPTNGAAFDPSLLANGTNMTKLVDGVVNFRIQAFDAGGRLISRPHTQTNYNIIDPNTHLSLVTLNVDVTTNVAFPGNYFCTFFSNAVPAYLEIELGVLESRVLDRFHSFSNNPVAAYGYLTNQVGRVHVFRQRISVRDVDPLAFQ